MCHSLMTVICTKQYLSNISNSIHKKVKQRWGWAGKKALLRRNQVNFLIYDQGSKKKKKKKRKRKRLVGRQNKNDIIWFSGSVFFLKNNILHSKHNTKKIPQFIIYYSNDKCFLVLVIYISLLCFISFFFFKKQKIIDFKKASWPKFCNINFLFLLKVGSVGPVDHQINLVSPNKRVISLDEKYFSEI